MRTSHTALRETSTTRPLLALSRLLTTPTLGTSDHLKSKLVVVVESPSMLLTGSSQFV